MAEVIREFFLAAPYPGISWPPTTTAQTHEVGVKPNGKPFLYKPDALLKAERDFKAALSHHRPEAPITNQPVRLIVKWLFDHKGKHQNGEYKLTRPDCSNLMKLFEDCMTDLGFWVDDSLVCSEIVEKFWADTPGIYVKIEVLDG